MRRKRVISRINWIIIPLAVALLTVVQPGIPVARASAATDSFTWTSNSGDSGNVFEAISCPSSSFCAAVDNSGNVLDYNGTS